MNKKAFGKSIKKFREDSKLTQRELAEKLGTVPQTISSWECGQTYPDLEAVEALCSALGIKEQDIFESTRRIEIDEGTTRRNIIAGVVATIAAVGLIAFGISFLGHKLSAEEKKPASVGNELSQNGPVEVSGERSQIYTIMRAALNITKDVKNDIPARALYVIEKYDDNIILSVKDSENDEEILKEWLNRAGKESNVFKATDKNLNVGTSYTGTVRVNGTIIWESEADAEWVKLINETFFNEQVEEYRLMMENQYEAQIKDAKMAEVHMLLDECVLSAPLEISSPYAYMDCEAYENLKKMGEEIVPVIVTMHENGYIDGLEDYIAVYLLFDISGCLDTLENAAGVERDNAEKMYNLWTEKYREQHKKLSATESSDK